MNRKPNSEERERLVNGLEDQISRLKEVSHRISGTLNTEKSTREGLADYLDKGTEALKKINGTLAEMGSNYSIFGCNGLIVVGIAILTILILILI